MARLSDLVNVNITRNSIKIQGVSIPVIFTLNLFLMWKKHLEHLIMNLKMNNMLAKVNLAWEKMKRN